MIKFLKNIKEKLGSTTESPHTGIEEAIELVVADSCPKIRLVRGHKKKLRGPVLSALDFISKLIDTIPTFDITSDSAVENLIKSFFLDKKQFKHVVANDPDLSGFLSRHSTDNFFILLTMDREVKTIFGSRLEGGIVTRDVALKSVNFSDHKFRVPSVAMDDLKHALKLGFIQILAHWSLEGILEEQARKEELKQLKDEMTVKLKMMTMERQQMVLEWNKQSGTQSYHAAQKLLDRIEDELNAINIRSLDTNYYISEVIRVLGKPDHYVTAGHLFMHLDHMGILLNGKAHEEKDDIRLLEIKLGDHVRRCCALLKCRRKSLLV